MATITVRVDDGVKSELYDVADKLGISVSSMINAFVKDTIRTKSISFSVYNEHMEDQEMYENKEVLKAKGQQSMESGRSSLVI